MAGSATLGSNLVDDLVTMADDLRGDLYADMGVAPWEVHVIKRRWSGVRRNEGVATIVSDTTLDPPPMVKEKDRLELIAAGREERGTVTLTGISLTYTEAELTGGTLAANEEFYWKFIDAHGQERATSYFVVKDPPATDRLGELGWTVTLLRAEVTV